MKLLSAYAAPVLVALVAYLLAGLIWDLPPYQVALTASSTDIHLHVGEAIVDTTLTYRAAHNRVTTVYLPFYRDSEVGDAENIQAVVPSPCSWEVRADGILLTLRWLTQDHETVHFHFSQPLKRPHYVYAFSLERAWLHGEAVVNYRVLADMPCQFNRPDGAVRWGSGFQCIENDTSGRELEIRW